MDQDRKKKRTRSEDSFSEKKKKKQHQAKRQEGGHLMNDNITSSPDHRSGVAAPGVFDFPWLKDGVVSKTEEYYWKLDDVFLSQLGESSTTSTTITTAAGIEFSLPGQCLCQTPVEAVLDFSDDNPSPPPLNEDNGLEKETNLDFVWSSLLNQPLIRQHN